MPLFNIFSNIWIYISSNQINSKENKKQYNEQMNMYYFGVIKANLLMKSKNK